MSDLPDVLEFNGNIVYRVDVADDPHLVDEERRKIELYGQILFQDSVIQLSAANSPQLQKSVLTHEIIHGLLHHAGFDEEQEQIAKILGYALPAFLQNNPQYVDYIMGESHYDQEHNPAEVPSVPNSLDGHADGADQRLSA